MDTKPGDRVLVDTADKQFEGIIMPSPIKTSIVVKLDSGYNVGIPKKTVKSLKVLKKYKEPKSTVGKLTVSKHKKIITILHTGGTIASKVDYETGGVVAKYTPAELVNMFPELVKISNIKSRLISNMFSEDLRFGHYNIMAKEIQKEVKAGVDGVILTHGTDTMHYTAAALSFILEDLPVPVILVGAQRSSDRGSSDAAMNLICASEFIVRSDFAEVGVCMHENADDEFCYILPGLKSRKMHSSRRDAFKAINVTPFAKVDFVRRKVDWIRNDYRKREKRKLQLKLFKDVKVGLLKMRPNMFEEELKAYSKFDGLILEGSGLGHWPINVVDELTTSHKKMYETLKKLTMKIPVAMTSQTIFGRVNMNVYSTGRELKAMGILGDQLDMTSETAYIKLAWLLSNYPKKVREMYSRNVRRELNDQITT